jgi:hypothetical protein
MPAEDSTVRPFKIAFPEADLSDLRRRVNATRWPERETVTDDTQGVRLALIQNLARLDHRAAEDHRAARLSHRARRERGGRVPSGDSVAAGLRVFGYAGYTGWDPARIAQAWVELMKRLGYTRFVAQGGGWGRP